MLLSIKSRLQYEATSRATVILNIEAQRKGLQRVLSERLELPPGVDAADHEVPETGNRYRRLILPVGSHRISYFAQVETTPVIADVASIDEVQVNELPFEVVPHLFPSRYCQSDWRGSPGDSLER